MEAVRTADRAAFARDAAAANAIVKASGLRVLDERRRGRGAALNPSGRFEAWSREVFDDGWESFEELPPFKTEVQVEKTTLDHHAQ